MKGAAQKEQDHLHYFYQDKSLKLHMQMIPNATHMHKTASVVLDQASFTLPHIGKNEISRENFSFAVRGQNDSEESHSNWFLLCFLDLSRHSASRLCGAFIFNMASDGGLETLVVAGCHWTSMPSMPMPSASSKNSLVLRLLQDNTRVGLDLNYLHLVCGGCFVRISCRCDAFFRW